MVTPTKEPTPAEFAVLIVFTATALVVWGIVELVLGFRAAPNKHDSAVMLEHHGFWCVVIGTAIAVAFWLFFQFKDD